MSDELFYIDDGDGGVAIPCQLKISEDCVEVGEFFESREDARQWAEEECWIFSGEWYLCVECNQQIMLNIAKLQTKKMN
jgi:hypothetical protein